MTERAHRHTTLPYVPALDGVRAVAVSAVLLFHGGHLAGGFLGVDLFFALSGSLITTLLLDEHDATGTIALGRFWMRRARRLVPALVLVVGATLAAVALLHGSADVAANRDEALASLGYASNWFAIARPSPYLTVLQHTWSLSIEAQFYAVWPVVVLLVVRGVAPDDGRRGAVRVLVTALAATATSATLLALLHDGGASLARVYFGTDTRATPILLGAALACVGRITREDGPAPTGTGTGTRGLDAISLAALGVLGVLTVTITRPDAWLYEWGYAFVVAPACVAVVAGARAGGLAARLLALAPLRLLGAISYGVYLWHWPVFFLANADRLQLTGWPLFALQCAVTLVLATLSYHLLELPIRTHRLSPSSGPSGEPTADAGAPRITRGDRGPGWSSSRRR